MDTLPNTNPTIEDCLEVLKALSDENRQKLLMLILSNGEMNAGEIADKYHLSRPAVSHHLSLMKRAKLLNLRRQGKEIFYSFNRDYVISLLESFISNLKTCCK